ncbi:MAG: Asp-tRNA(Asn)/Glu-tRNA(Gln) amidotransferase subunit GatB [Clostridiales bacterium]|nr:Asp-tRNA(Asn)/Glu-tRNA(Gln) amidotransferase subunit GatB [Clostridiales bacterium]
MIKDYEMVIGLEVHVELKTETKIFCSCPTTFGAAPNTQTCPVCLGLPGTLPVLNGKVVDYAVKAGLATNCTIARYSKQDRKNYFYPDLPKAYQISQYDLPLCEHGWLDIETAEGAKRIGITRIHIEEDAGKLVHDDEKGTMIDCNRCGVPLIEIVSEPDIRSAEEAKAYLQKLRAIILYTGVSDCKMNEGSLRCDVNLSVRKKGTEAFGTRTEMKNLNSFQFIVKAIEYEYKRQVEAIEAGEKIIQETRRFDANSGKTYSMRTKENANDYRYFPDPDLPPIKLTDEKIAALQAQIPRLPDARKKEYMEKYGLSAYDGEVLTTDMALADYFEQAAAETKYPKLVANMLLSEVMRLADGEDSICKILPNRMAALASLSGDGVINSATVKKLIKELWEADFDVEEKVVREGLAQVSDEAVILKWVQEAIQQNPKSVADYKKGKKAAAKAIVGKVMAVSGGKANPTVVDRLVEAQLNQ